MKRGQVASLMPELLVGVEDLLQLGWLEHRAPCCQTAYSLQPSCSGPALDSAPILALALSALAETPAQAVIGR